MKSFEKNPATTDKLHELLARLQHPPPLAFLTQGGAAPETVLWDVEESTWWSNRGTQQSKDSKGVFKSLVIFPSVREQLRVSILMPPLKAEKALPSKDITY